MSPLYHTEALLSLFHTVAFNYALLYLLHDSLVFRHLFAFEVFLSSVLILSLVAFPYTGVLTWVVLTYQCLTVLIMVPDMVFSYGHGNDILGIQTRFDPGPRTPHLYSRHFCLIA